MCIHLTMHYDCQILIQCGIYCTAHTTVNNCLNENYNEEKFKAYVNDLGYDFEVGAQKDGLFR